MVEHVAESDERAVAVRAHPLARELGQVNRQRSVRAEQPEPEDREARATALAGGLEGMNLRGRKRERWLLTDAQRFEARHRCATERRRVGILGVDPPQHVP